jgi:CDP-2,3-bis-(O-geranylgeranyl)-sn-glycerol synthase
MLHDVLVDLFVFLPAFVANAAPVVAKNLPGLQSLNRPIYATYMGKNKTWRGFLSGLIAAVATAMLLHTIGSLPYVGFVALHHYSLAVSAFAGFLLGCGAIGGDMAESWVKRRLGIKPGNALPYWDGVDYVLGAILLLSPLYRPSLAGFVALLLIGPLASLIANTVAYSVGWKQQWY